MHPSKNNQRAIKIYLWSTLFLTGVSLVFWLTGISDRHSFYLRFLFFDPAPPFGDLLEYRRLLNWRSQGALVLNPPGAHTNFNYFPAGFFALLFFLSIPSHPVAALIAVVTIAGLSAAGLMAWRLRNHRLAWIAPLVAVCTSYPFAFGFDRGNIEGLVWIPTAAGIACFVRQKYFGAAVLIALAASVKPFPGLLMILFLMERRFREFLAGAVAFLVIMIGSLLIIGPSLQAAVIEFAGGFKSFTERYVTVYVPGQLGADHSLFSIWKMCIRVWKGWPAAGSLKGAMFAAYPYYTAFAVLLMCVSIFLLWRKPLLNRIFGLSALILIVPPANYDYTLIMMYIPWALLLLDVSTGTSELDAGPVNTIMLCCAIVFTSQFYLFAGLSTALGPLVKCLALLIILAISLFCMLPSKGITVRVE